MPRSELFEFLLENRHLLGLLEQHGQQGELKWQERFGLPNGGDVAARRGKETIENVLVSPAQGAAEGDQRTLDLVQVIRDGADGASHEMP
jgi:hypothetical protein